MSLHTWPCQGPHKPSSCITFTLNSHWGRAVTSRKSCTYARRVTSLVSDSLQPSRLWLARLLCQAGGSPGKDTRACWPILVAILFQSTISTAALASNSPEDLVLPEPLRPKKLHHLHSWPFQGQTQVLQGSLRSKPQWTTHIQRWGKKHTIETQGQCG